MKKLLVLLSVVLVLVSCQGEERGTKQDITQGANDLPTIQILQIVEHPSLDTIRESAIEELEVLGYIEGETAIIDYKNASNDMSILNTLVGNLSGKDIDAVIAIATPTAQATAKLSDEIPVVFSAVSDPVGAGLVKDLNDTTGNITGTSDEIQVDKILELGLKFVPEAKKIGVLFNPSETNSTTNLEKAKAFAESQGLEIIEQGASNSSEVKQSAEILAGKCDFIFAPNDNTVASAMASVTQVQKENKVPVFTGADSMVMDGGLSTMGIDYEELGRESGRMVAQIIEGKSVSEIPVKVFDDDLNIYVNMKTLKDLGLKLPNDIANDSKLQKVE